MLSAAFFSLKAAVSVMQDSLRSGMWRVHKRHTRYFIDGVRVDKLTPKQERAFDAAFSEMDRAGAEARKAAGF